VLREDLYLTSELITVHLLFKDSQSIFEIHYRYIQSTISCSLQRYRCYLIPNRCHTDVTDIAVGEVEMEGEVVRDIVDKLL
jgi:hypothetical protein